MGFSPGRYFGRLHILLRLPHRAAVPGPRSEITGTRPRPVRPGLHLPAVPLLLGVAEGSGSVTDVHKRARV